MPTLGEPWELISQTQTTQPGRVVIGVSCLHMVFFQGHPSKYYEPFSALLNFKWKPGLQPPHHLSSLAGWRASGQEETPLVGHSARANPPLSARFYSTENLSSKSINQSKLCAYLILITLTFVGNVMSLRKEIPQFGSLKKTCVVILDGSYCRGLMSFVT